jgi:hypothetical protein
MAKSIRVYTKKNRAEQAGTMVGVRLQPDQLAALDAWIGQQSLSLSRPEAVRRLIGSALKCEQDMIAIPADPNDLEDFDVTTGALQRAKEARERRSR